MYQDQRDNLRWTVPHLFLSVHKSEASKLLVFGSCFVALATSSDISHIMNRSKQKAEPRSSCFSTFLIYPLIMSLILLKLSNSSDYTKEITSNQECSIVIYGGGSERMRKWQSGSDWHFPKRHCEVNQLREAYRGYAWGWRTHTSTREKQREATC